MTDRLAIRTGRSRGAFTLVEMLVAIGIIVALAVITVTASIALSQRSEIRQTEDVISLLDVALQEWETQADRKLTFRLRRGSQMRVPGVFDMFDDAPHVYTLSEVLYRIGRSTEVKEVLAHIRPEFMYVYDTDEAEEPAWIRVVDPDDPDPNADKAASRYNAGELNDRKITGMLAVLDAWGTPIRAVHPGPLWELGDGREFDDADGTVTLTSAFSEYGAEGFYGVANGRRVLFVSAGPDGKFGNIEASNEDEPQHAQAHDNIYSYPIVDDHPDE